MQFVEPVRFATVPAEQRAHEVALVKSLKVPTSHSKQLDWPVVSWYLPVEQSSHSVNPVELDNRPAAHSVQLDALVSLPYLPASHALQAFALLVME